MFYLIDKPKGISSFKAISIFAKENCISKIGHSGTLDPLATGALLVATGSDTKLLSYISNKNKTYVVTFKIGYISNTYDVEGTIEKVSNKIVTLKELKKIAKKFQGKIKQVPPGFSAKKVNGQRSYHLARKGIKVELKSIDVEILKIYNFKEIASNTFSFEVEVSNGTYIRSLVNDIGLKFNSGAIMTELRRTKIGSLLLQKNNQKINPFDIIKMKKIILKDITGMLYGKIVKINKKDNIYLLIFKNQIIGIGEIKNNILKSKKILGKRVQKIYNIKEPL